MRAAALVLAAVGLACGLAGCLRGDPLAWKVSAKNSRALASWRAKVDAAMGSDNRRRLDEALAEIRSNVAGSRAVDRWLGAEPGSKAEAIDDAVCRRIHDQPLRDVLQLGYELPVARLREEFAALENAVKTNAGLVTKPGDVDSRDWLEGFRQRQGARLQKCSDELAAAERELQPLFAASGRRMVKPSTDTLDLTAGRAN